MTNANYAVSLACNDDKQNPSYCYIAGTRATAEQNANNLTFYTVGATTPADRSLVSVSIIH